MLLLWLFMLLFLVLRKMLGFLVVEDDIFFVFWFKKYEVAGDGYAEEKCDEGDDSTVGPFHYIIECY